MSFRDKSVSLWTKGSRYSYFKHLAPASDSKQNNLSILSAGKKNSPALATSLPFSPSPSFYFLSAKQPNKTQQCNNVASTAGSVLAFSQSAKQKGAKSYLIVFINYDFKCKYNSF